VQAATLGICVTQSGNVGIGTANPQQLLHVHGLSGGGGAQTALQLTNPATGWALGNGLFIGLDNIGDAFIYNYSNTSLSIATNGAERMRITAAGNVGIETSSPVATIHAVNYINYNPSTTYGSAAAYILNSAGVEVAMGTSSIAPYAYWMQCRLGSNAAQPLALNPLGGSIGIGTLNPPATLTVVGPPGLGHYGGAWLGLAVMGAAGYSDIQGIDFAPAFVGTPTARISVVSTASGSLMYFGTSSDYGAGITNAALQIDSAGNVLIQNSLGIGNWVGFPGLKLHVHGGRAVITSASDPYGLYFQYNNGSPGVWLGVDAASRFQLGDTAGNPIVLVDQGGNMEVWGNIRTSHGGFQTVGGPVISAAGEFVSGAGINTAGQIVAGNGFGIGTGTMGVSGHFYGANAPGSATFMITVQGGLITAGLPIALAGTPADLPATAPPATPTVIVVTPASAAPFRRRRRRSRFVRPGWPHFARCGGFS
jgi:hypothetical protein